jgi:type III pantothenate kinase
VPGLQAGYLDPDQLGDDRWLAMAGALMHTSPPLVVVDAGTAMTIDLVDAAGCHRGGWILPGLHSMQSQLLARTAVKKMPAVNAQLAPGLSTPAAMANGTLLALVGALNQVAKEPAWAGSRWLLSGGDGQRLQSHLAFPTAWVENLVLDGLISVGARRESG